MMMLEVTVIFIPTMEYEKESNRRTVLSVEKGESKEMVSHKGQEFPQCQEKRNRREAWGQLDRGESSGTGCKRKRFHEEIKA